MDGIGCELAAALLSPIVMGVSFGLLFNGSPDADGVFLRSSEGWLLASVPLPVLTFAEVYAGSAFPVDAGRRLVVACGKKGRLIRVGASYVQLEVPEDG